MNTNESAEVQHLLARRAYEAGSLRSAMRTVEQCLAADDDDGRAWELCGLIHYSSGNAPNAVKALERASILVPLKNPGRVCLAHAYGRVGKTDLAIDLLTDLSGERCISIPLLLQVATGLDSLDRPDLAMETCRNIIRRDEHIAQAHYDLGFYGGRCGGPESMVEALARKAIELDPDTARYRVGLAGLLWKQERKDEAYTFVAELTNDELESICCRCCLSRVIDLYEAAEDLRRVIVARQRLVELEMMGTESDCG